MSPLDSTLTRALAVSSDAATGWHDGAAILFAVLLCVFVSAYNDYSQMLAFRALNAVRSRIARRARCFAR